MRYINVIINTYTLIEITESTQLPQPSNPPTMKPTNAPTNTNICERQELLVNTTLLVNTDKYYNCLPFQVDVGKCVEKMDCPTDGHECFIADGGTNDQQLLCREKPDGAKRITYVTVITSCDCKIPQFVEPIE